MVRKDGFSQDLFISITLHLVLVLFFTVKTLFFQKEPIVLQDSIRVDIVGLPEKIKEKPKVKPKPVAKKKAKPKKKINLRKTRSKQQSALARLKARSAMERLKNYKPKKKEVAKKEEPAAPPVEYKGNVLSPGTELRGLARLQHDRYLSQVKRHIQQNWFLPEWLRNGEFKAQVEVKINKNGQITEKKIIASSQNNSFDNLVLQTIENSNPVPKPPEKFRDILAVSGVVLKFPQ